MTNWILTSDCDRIFRTNDCDLRKESILDGALNLLDLLDSLIVSQAIQEKIDV